MNKVGYTDQNRLDPQWAPSDAEMINWVEERGYHVLKGCAVSHPWEWWIAENHHAIIAIGYGPTWRAAVEDAMRKEVRL